MNSIPVLRREVHYVVDSSCMSWMKIRKNLNFASSSINAVTSTDWRASTSMYVPTVNEIGISQVRYVVAIKAINSRQ